MMDNPVLRGSRPRPAHLVRAGVVVGLSLVSASGAVVLCHPPLVMVRDQLAAGRLWSALPLDLLVSAIAALVLLGCATWLVVVTVATALEAVTGASVALVRAVSPGVVRRLVLVCCGVAVGSTAVLTPAVAAGPPALAGAVAANPALSDGAEQVPGPEQVGLSGQTLSGLPLPDRTTGGPPPHQRYRQPVPPVTLTPVAAHVRPTTHRVRPGESLWSIAQRLLPGAGPADVDRAWRRVYRENRSLIGSDPDLLVPGTTLRLPLSLRSQAGPPSGELDTHHHRKDAS